MLNIFVFKDTAFKSQRVFSGKKTPFHLEFNYFLV